MAGYSSGDRTRENLVNAAGELAAELGFSRVTTREVAKRAGENVGSIHYHFGSKEKLFEAVVYKAIDPQLKNPLSDVLAPYMDRLDDRTVQAEAVVSAVRWFMGQLFYDDKPLWCCRVIYQLLQSPGHLRDLAYSVAIEPGVESFRRLLRRVDGSLSFKDSIREMLIICSPIFFHADYRDIIGRELGVESYCPDYLEGLERSVLKRTLFALGLADQVEKIWNSSERGGE
ncbi:MULTISPECIES: TetR/AcrR family transcriptional regulator [Dethiosulfovibrio]|uniref:TetR/AcrR family transcriptional regulator n=2 Tax=Dethiosulfovibrio TaxID=47054 RepID=A0ABS9EPR9_9BACT|nr:MULTISPECIES: TetR/AcrR family transcriptional regulator [Dethiosulfovibrio]MCF4113197.1 TetR/AcrR family transcriptional regulator [Dethiosulfovibrio russensis]MCF4142261.1 TetR/AcrR family transcriptional regulator [Dethiosulfovibrio marinus]MCF4144569.1 TetR/AcrR family transcriptional regulator [Dethiosulfovibrio acidaminovorans]